MYRLIEVCVWGLTREMVNSMQLRGAKYSIIRLNTEPLDCFSPKLHFG